MPKRLDLLAGSYISSVLLLVLCSRLGPQTVHQAFSTLVTLDTRAQLDAPTSVDIFGRCSLGDDQLSCRDLATAVIRHGMTGYETEDQFHSLMRGVSCLESVRKLLTAFTFFHGMLLLGCYALLSLEWYVSGTKPDPACERLLQRMTTGVLLLATLAGTAATASGLAVGLQYSEVLGAGNSAGDMVRIGSGWMITLCASIACFYATVASANLAGPDSGEEEGRIALPLDDGDKGPRREKYEYRPTAASP